MHGRPHRHCCREAALGATNLRIGALSGTPWLGPAKGSQTFVRLIRAPAHLSFRYLVALDHGAPSVFVGSKN